MIKEENTATPQQIKVNKAFTRQSAHYDEDDKKNEASSKKAMKDMDNHTKESMTEMDKVKDAFKRAQDEEDPEKCDIKACWSRHCLGIRIGIIWLHLHTGHLLQIHQYFSLSSNIPICC